MQDCHNANKDIEKVNLKFSVLENVNRLTCSKKNVNSAFRNVKEGFSETLFLNITKQESPKISTDSLLRHSN